MGRTGPLVRIQACSKYQGGGNDSSYGVLHPVDRLPLVHYFKPDWLEV